MAPTTTFHKHYLKDYRRLSRLLPCGHPGRAQQLRERPDIRASWRAALKEEASFAYKAIDPVIEILRHAEVAQPVAELHPVLTLKG